MTSVHIRTTDAKAKIISYIANLFGARVISETPAKDPLVDVIEKAEQAFAEGKGVRMTTDELRDFING